MFGRILCCRDGFVYSSYGQNCFLGVFVLKCIELSTIFVFVNYSDGIRLHFHIPF